MNENGINFDIECVSFHSPYRIRSPLVTRRLKGLEKINVVTAFDKAA